MGSFNELFHAIEKFKDNRSKIVSDFSLFYKNETVKYSKMLLYLVSELSSSPKLKMLFSLAQSTSESDAFIIEDNVLFTELVDFFSENHHSINCNVCKGNDHQEDGSNIVLSQNLPGDILVTVESSYNPVQSVEENEVENSNDIAQSEELENLNNFAQTGNQDNSKDLFYCEFCGKAFVQPSQLSNHFYKMHYNTGKEFKCKDCDKIFKRMTDLRKHEAVHKDHNYECKECAKKFKRKADMQRHEISHSVNFQCNFCSSSFTQKKHLMRHFNSLHSNEKSCFKCSNCGKVFNRSDNFKRHIKCCTK